MRRGLPDRIVTVGEVVWDCFPDREVLGGAPVNVAYHLACLSRHVLPVTRVGDDQLGRRTLTAIAGLGLATEGVQTDPILPTGRVQVTFDQGGEPRFEIATPAAWDAIDEKAVVDLLDGTPFLLVHGTLAQRDPRSRGAIGNLRRRAGFCCYDVNLRPPFTGRELVLESLAGADLVKVNGNELATLAGWCSIGGAPAEQAAELCRRNRLHALVVTEGADGAWVMAGGAVARAPGVTVAVVDTVGAGDCFLAGVISGMLDDLSWPEILARANRRAAWVAARRGATPPMPAGEGELP
ncbi:MAG: PfkB family carbohydrate kinase [Thermodesulfobacteriota bacterium]